MIEKNVFLNKWKEVTGFNFRKLLEDNQNVSLPMITRLGSEIVIFAFVYSFASNNRLIVSQRHFWSADRHQMMLCKKIYSLSTNKLIVTDENDYLKELQKVTELLFVNDLSEESKKLCNKYFSFFDTVDLKKIYFSENKPLIHWAKHQTIL